VSNAALSIVTENKCYEDRGIKVHIRRTQLHGIMWNAKFPVPYNKNA
jgi:hypothetical protein